MADPSPTVTDAPAQAVVIQTNIPTQTISAAITQTLAPPFTVVLNTDPVATVKTKAAPTAMAAIKTYTIEITEVMANPCGVDDRTEADWNEYIEIYNYGGSPVDVCGLWFTDGDNKPGNPDEIIAWDESLFSAGLSFGPEIETKSTIIPPSGFAVVLALQYLYGKGNSKMPYFFRQAPFS